MKNIICYCAGGLGNRLKPLASCYILAKQKNTNLIICWDNTSIRCMAKFEELFKNDFNIITSDKLHTYENITIVGNKTAMHNDATHNNIFGLRDLVLKYNMQDHVTFNTDNLLVYRDTFLMEYDYKPFFKSLEPIDAIQSKIDYFSDKLQLNKNVIGVHIRGTDFNTDISVWETQIKNIKDKIFLCSDDESIENHFKKFSNVVVRDEKSYVSKLHKNKNWSKNVLTTSENVQDGLVDLYLLAKTNLKIYNKTSAFVHLIKEFEV